MPYKTNCEDCGDKLIVPSWARCPECSKIREKKRNLTKYHANKDLRMRRYKDWRKRNKEKLDVMKKENHDLFRKLAKEIYGVDVE